MSILGALTISNTSVNIRRRQLRLSFYAIAVVVAFLFILLTHVVLKPDRDANTTTGTEGLGRDAVHDAGGQGMHDLHVLARRSAKFVDLDVDAPVRSDSDSGSRSLRARHGHSSHSRSGKSENTLDRNALANDRNRKRYFSIDGRWKDMRASLGLKPLPDVLYDPSPEADSKRKAERVDPLVQNSPATSKYKRNALSTGSHASLSGGRIDEDLLPALPTFPSLFLSDDAHAVHEESLEDLLEAFKAIAQKNHLEKARQRLIHGELQPMHAY